MKLLWVTSNRMGSKLIRWGLDTDCSHFAICFDEGEVEDPYSDVAQGIAFHSYGHGTQLEWLGDFLCRYYVVHALETVEPLSLQKEEAVYKAILKEESSRAYDYCALAWFAWRTVLYKVLGWELAGVNRWQAREARLCTGIAPAVLKALGFQLATPDVELMRPHDLMNAVLSTGCFRLADAWAREARLCHEAATSSLVTADVVSGY